MVSEGFKNGSAAPTSEETLIDFLQTLAQSNDWVIFMTPKFTSEEGRTIPYVLLSSNNTASTKLLGIEVETVEEDFVGEVEAYNITSANLATSKFQGVAQTYIVAELMLRNVSIPKGGFKVASRQRRAAHAFVRLEPEAQSSLARWNVVNVGKGDIYPAFRIPRKN